jgi:hypothetical protein
MPCNTLVVSKDHKVLFPGVVRVIYGWEMEQKLLTLWASATAWAAVGPSERLTKALAAYVTFGKRTTCYIKNFCQILNPYG